MRRIDPPPVPLNKGEAVRSLFPVPCCLLPVTCSLFPVPCSLLPVPCSLFPARSAIDN
ncbi:hypothetical protein [Moorena producens]|uniref:hypothetical protein n=1 Tax=Moorena producens TaxID=1155739 RepID=UPI003C71C510